MARHGDDTHNARRKFLTRSATLVAAGATLPILPTLARTLSDEFSAPVAGISANYIPNSRMSIHGENGTLGLALLDTAISKMLALPPEDPRNWYRQAMIHVLDCPHGNAWFFPWHRGYLYWFERIARQLTGYAIGVPYWDWTTNPNMPEYFYGYMTDTNKPGFIHDFATFDSTFRGPMQTVWARYTTAQRQQLDRRGMTSFEVFWATVQGYFNRPTKRLLTTDNRQLTGATLQAVSLPTLTNALAPTDFFEFGGSMVSSHHDMTGVPGLVESQPHNLVHDAVGGYMGDFIAASDPVFWAHHANIDRLWEVWMRRQGMSFFDGPTAWKTEPFLFFCDENGRSVDNTAWNFAGGGNTIWEEAPPIPVTPSRPPNASWPSTFSSQLQSTTLPINGGVTASFDPGKAACDAFSQNCQTAILLELDRPMDQSAWRFRFELQIEGSSFSAKDCGSATFFGTMAGMKHRSKLKIGIADGMKQCLNEAGPGPHRFAVTVRAEPVDNRLPTEVLNVYSATLTSV